MDLKINTVNTERGIQYYLTLERYGWGEIYDSLISRCLDIPLEEFKQLHLSNEGEITIHHYYYFNEINNIQKMAQNLEPYIIMEKLTT